MNNNRVNFGGIIEPAFGEIPTLMESRDDFYKLTEKYSGVGIHEVPGGDHCRVINTANGKTYVCNSANNGRAGGDESVYVYRKEDTDGKFVQVMHSWICGKTGFEPRYEAYTMAANSYDAYPLAKPQAEELFWTINAAVNTATEHFAGASFCP